MKTRIIIISAILAFNYTMILAKPIPGTVTESPLELRFNSLIPFLMPVSPKEATFGDGMDFYEATTTVSILALVPPGEAGFNDVIPEPATGNTIFAPSVPREATFEDEIVPDNSNHSDLLNSVAPVIPEEADFNDNNSENSLPENFSPAIPAEAGFEDSL